MLQPSKIFAANGQVAKIAKAYRDMENISVFGVSPFAKAAIIASCGENVDGATLVVCPDYYAAKECAAMLSVFSSSVELLPARADSLSYRDTRSGESVSSRYAALARIASDEAKFVVASVEAALQPLPEREEVKSRSLRLRAGQEYDLSKLCALFIGAGYKREPQLSDVGRFSLRGDILDVWSPAEKSPARIEFFGDEVESVRLLDEESNTSLEEADTYFIAPMTEFFPESVDGVTKRLREEKSGGLSPDAAARKSELVSLLCSRVDGGDRSGTLDYLLPLCRSERLVDFGRFAGVVIDGTKQCYDGAALLKKEHLSRFTALLSRGETLSFLKDSLLDIEEALCVKTRALAFQSIDNANKFFAPTVTFTVKTNELPKYFRDLSVLVGDINTWLVRGYTVYLCEEEGRKNERVREFLRENDIFPCSGYGNSGVRIVTSAPSSGAIFHDERVVIIGGDELIPKKAKKTIKRAKRDVFSQPEAGDFVVHDKHGIGKFEGIVKLEVGGVRRDYLLVVYAGEDKLYVPAESMDTLSKYVADGGEPKLSRLGGADFAKIKEKVAAGVKTLAIDLIALYGERLKNKGHVYSQDDSMVDDFARTFPYTETDDQLTAIAEGLNDLKKGKIMDRLLCGDVGYGKTEVALRVAFKVIVEGKQVAFMAPTTILASQHYETVKRRMEEYGVRVDRLTRFDGKKEQEKTIAALKSGKLDIVVGTHRLLGKDVNFADLGLLILDEEQRFGVADKEKIKDVRRNVNVLTLSATPIPRTLHMSLVGIRDISVLDTPPVERLPVQTFVMEYTESLIIDACERELGRDGQVFVVYNRVQNIAEFAGRVKKLVPQAAVDYAHGQMAEDALENKVRDFVEGRTDILVSSTIVENGIDIPRANTMIVVDADKLGLSQLYQLRGRVGRSNRLAYVFFTYDGRKTLTESAYKRLEAITRFTEFGSGFRIAMRDLEIRGAGSILGAKQHGHMEKVGYDMYCKLLKEAVGELSGEKVEHTREIKTIADYPTFIPETYVPDKEWRLRVYSRISRVKDIAERNGVLADLADAYGKVPESVKNLVDLALIKNLAARVGASSVTMNKRKSSLGFDKVMDVDNRVLSECTKQDGKLILSEKPSLDFPSNTKMLKFLLNCQNLRR